MDARASLIELEHSGEFLFHGSAAEAEFLEPRQAYNFIHGEHVPDGAPAVHASSLADYAIFMAIINRVNCPKGCHSSAGLADGKLVLRATPETMAQLGVVSRGFVYVFDRAGFIDRGGSEWASYVGVKPVRVVEVGFVDMPNDIGVLE